MKKFYLKNDKGCPSEIRKQTLQAILAVKAAISESQSLSKIPQDVELLTVPQVALLTGWGESVVRQRNRDGLLPKPLRFGGTIQWGRKEILAWICVKCPSREQWERIWKGENTNGTA